MLDTFVCKTPVRCVVGSIDIGKVTYDEECSNCMFPYIVNRKFTVYCPDLSIEATEEILQVFQSNVEMRLKLGRSIVSVIGTRMTVTRSTKHPYGKATLTFTGNRHA
jgi:hypothetical protein